MEAEIQATFEHCGSFNSKLKDTLTSLLNANNDRKGPSINDVHTIFGIIDPPLSRIHATYQYYLSRFG